jgi:hypothetical protein
MKRTWGRVVVALVLLVVLLGVAIQFVRPSVIETNPPIVAEPAWPSPEGRALAARACFDCHSNETGWPWYSRLAPLSWLIARDVEEGRRRLNFSEWGTARREREIGEVVREGEMPPILYLLLHPSARLTSAEKDILARDLQSLR